MAGLHARLITGWSPLPYTLGATTTVTNGEVDLTEQFLGARVDGFVLEVRFRAGFTDSMTALVWERLELVGDDGSRVDADVWGTSFQSTTGALTGEMVVTCRTWTALPATAPVLWVGRLAGARRVERWMGNLQIQRPDGDGARVSSGHLWVESPSARLGLLWPETGDDPEWLVVEPRGPLDPRMIWRDRMLLRVMLGVPVHVTSFVALNAEGEPVGALVDNAGVGGQETSGMAGALVPLRPSADVGRRAWGAPFFRKLSESYRMDGVADPVTTAVFRYAHTLGQLDVDTEFVLVAGATWVLVRALAGTGDDTLPPQDVVMDGLVAADAALRQRDGGALREALQVVASYVEGDRERAYLLGLDAEAGQIVYDELVRSRAVWDRGTLRAEGTEATQASAIEGVVRVSRMRRAFGVLLAHAIGYGGPVGRFRDVVGDEPWGWLPDPPTDAGDLEDAGTVYLAATEQPVAPAWPGFHAPEVPDTPLTREFVAFADGLRDQTGGAVTARLRPLPHRDEEPLRLSFRLRLAADPSVHVSLFAVQFGNGEVEVQGWGDDVVTIRNEAEVAVFGAEVARSEELRYQVQRLLLIGDDLRHGEIAPRT